MATTDLLVLLQHLKLWPAGAAPADPAALRTFVERLEASARPLNKLRWKATDLEGALGAALTALGRHRLDGALGDPVAFLDAQGPLVERGLPDAQLKAHQLGHVAQRANRMLAAAGDERRFRCFGPALAWREDEPPWVLVVPEEAEALLALAGPPAPPSDAYEA